VWPVEHCGFPGAKRFALEKRRAKRENEGGKCWIAAFRGKGFMTSILLWKISARFLLALPLAAALAQSPAKNGQEDKPAADIAAGKTIYEKRCAVCHFAASDAKKVGPGLKGLKKRGTYADGKPVTEDSLRAWIENGGKNMPGFKASLSAEQVRDLIAYLKTL
jgi:cytochrome c2